MSITIPPLTELCSRCQVLEYDDSAWPGAYKAAEGYYLEIPNDLRSNLNSTKCQFTLDYELIDSLPGLPLLSEAAQNRCGFCSVLKRAIQRCARAHSQRVSVHLWYTWYWAGVFEDDPSFGLKSLIANVSWIRHDEVKGMTEV